MSGGAAPTPDELATAAYAQLLVKRALLATLQRLSADGVDVSPVTVVSVLGSLAATLFSHVTLPEGATHDALVDDWCAAVREGAMRSLAAHEATALTSRLIVMPGAGAKES